MTRYLVIIFKVQSNLSEKEILLVNSQQELENVQKSLGMREQVLVGTQKETRDLKRQVTQLEERLQSK